MSYTTDKPSPSSEKCDRHYANIVSISAETLKFPLC